MKIFLGADHGGFQSKEALKSWLQDCEHEVVDCGAYELDPTDDYPIMAETVSRAVSADEQESQSSVGILICRSGGGMVIAANKIAGIRAVEVFDESSARHAKEHNNANVISLAADWHDLDQLKKITQAFLETRFTQEERHQRRLQQISNLE